LSREGFPAAALARLGIATIAVVSALVPASAASASERHASPTGAGEACTTGAPCSLRQAVTEAETNDEVILATGTYRLESPVIAPDGVEGLFIHGDYGSPPPLVEASVAKQPLGFADTGGRLSYLDISNEAPSAYGVECILGGFIERLRVTVRGPNAVGAAQGAGCRVHDTLFLVEGDGAIAVHATDGETSTVSEAEARNVTAIATGPGSIGIRVDYLGVGPILSMTLILQNSIASGTRYDIYTYGLGDPGVVVASYSNFDTTAAEPPHGRFVFGNGNQTASPLFVDPAAGDFRELAASPTVDAGTTNNLVAPLDLAGTPRPAGLAPDIGAYELAPVPPPPPPRPAIGRIESLRVKPRRVAPFESDDRGRRRPATGGAQVTYRLSAAARVRFGAEEKAVGRIVKGNCLRLTRFNREQKECTAFFPLKGSFRRSGKRGANHFRFLGRFAGKMLEPGRYRLVASAGGSTVRAPFTIAGAR
jgi:hypothetical protein